MSGVEPETEVVDNESEQRYEIRLGDELAGFLAYERGPGRIELIHTEVDDRFGGQGIGSRLTSSVLDSAREAELEVVPSCDFVKSYIDKHPDYRDLIAADAGQ